MMSPDEPLPPAFLASLDALEMSYLAETDTIRQSGFGGGAERSRAEREPILESLPGGGERRDIGCANGYLLECLVAWGRERGVTIEPCGLDAGTGLIALARQRLPHLADRLWVGNAWNWTPPRRFDNVYTLLDLVPPTHLTPFLRRLAKDIVAPGGRLIAGDYGSRSRGVAACDVASTLRDAGFTVAGETSAGDGIARFAWADLPR